MNKALYDNYLSLVAFNKQQIKGTFKYHTTVFLINFRRPPLYDGILTFSANPLPPYDVLNQPPSPI